MSLVEAAYLILVIIVTFGIGYGIGYHRGEVDKHKEIFDLLLGSDWREVRESEIRNRGI